MGATFTTFSRWREGGEATLDVLSPSIRHVLPEGFEAVAEAIAEGQNPTAACMERGRTAVRDGISLGEVLSGLRETYRLVVSREPDFVASEALAVSWSESTLEFLHELSCEDPISGLASQPHMRTRFADIYRGAERRGEDVTATSALVIVELPDSDGETIPHFERLLWLSRIGEAARTVFSGEETIAALGAGRVAVLVARHAALGASVTLLRGLLTELRLPVGNPRVWIEGLPPTSASAVRLLGELAR